MSDRLPSVSFADPSVIRILEILRYQTNKTRKEIFEKLGMAYCIDCGKLQPATAYCVCVLKEFESL